MTEIIHGYDSNWKKEALKIINTVEKGTLKIIIPEYEEPVFSLEIEKTKNKESLLSIHHLRPQDIIEIDVIKEKE
jgi:hypothetical protein